MFGKSAEESSNNCFLDPTIAADFRDTIKASPIFCNSKQHKHRYNLICTVMDRIDSAINVLNKYGAQPESEEDFIMFLVYACMVKDGIYKLYESVFHKKPPFINSNQYFSHASGYTNKLFTTNTCPTDDVFFEYLRAMAFAHPYETGYYNRPFLTEGEKQCCPWVIVKGMLFGKIKNPVGIRVYTNKNEDGLQDIFVSFDSLKAYINKRYGFLKELKEWALSEIEKQNDEWIITKINRNNAPIEVFREISRTLTERFAEDYGVLTAIADLECPLSCSENTASVGKYRQSIIELIPSICDAVDNLDNERVSEIIDKIVYCIPEKTHEMCHYQLEKIFNYLDVRSPIIDTESGEYWGLFQAYNFSKGFAKNWVTINVREMPYDEIKLLVRTACYLENEKQQRAKKNDT